MNKTDKWLKYYRNCIVDSDRKPVIFEPELGWVEHEIIFDQINADIKESLFGSTNNEEVVVDKKELGDDNEKLLDVDIAPFMLIPKIVGSFNWLSAVRDADSSYQRYDNSVVLMGDGVSEKIEAELEVLGSLAKFDWKP